MRIRGLKSARSRGSAAARKGCQSTDFLELFSNGDSRCAAPSKRRKQEQRPEANFVAARSSINQLYDVLYNFDEMKKDIVRSIGFGGLLYFPPIRQLNRRFAVWLMSKVDPLAQTLVIDDERKIKFSKEDVALVFGIPCNGRSVYEGAMPRKEVVNKILSFFAWNREKDNRSIKAALEVIERDYSGSMTDCQQSAFKVAFVIYVMSTLLSPGAKYDYASVDYWDALVQPSEIHTFDWAHYVIHRLFDAVLKVKSDLTLYNKVTSKTGCCLFLQVLYLDSIDLGVINMPHTSFPRVSQFKPDLMKSMILADTHNVVDEASIFCFGKSKLRPPNEVCYYWAKVVDGDIPQLPCSEQVGLWRVASAVAGSVKLPSEVAGVLHFVVEEFVKDKCRCKSVNGIDFVAILLAVIEPFVRGFRYTTLTDCNAEVIGNLSCKSGIGLLCSMISQVTISYGLPDLEFVAV